MPARGSARSTSRPTAGRADVLALVREADVMVDNYRPGVLAASRPGLRDIKAINPRIIYCAISGYGYSDPQRTPQGAYDHVIQALTGMTMLSGSEGDPPVKTGFPVVDSATGSWRTGHRAGAERSRSDRRRLFPRCEHVGQCLQLMYPFACDTLTGGEEIPRVGNKGFSGSPAADTFECSDGWLAIGANTPPQIGHLMRC